MSKKQKKPQKISIPPRFPLRERHAYKYALEFVTVLSLFVTVWGFILSYIQKPPPSQAPGRLQTLIGGIELHQEQDVWLYLGMHTIKLDGAYLAQFPLALRNNGESTIRNIQVVCTFPKIARGDMLNLLTNNFDGPLRDTLSVEALPPQINGETSVQTFRVESVNPGVAMAIFQALPFHRTDVSAEAEVRPGVKVSVKLQYGYMIKFEIYAENIPAMSYNAFVSMLTASDAVDFKEQVHHRVFDQMNNEWKKWPWWKRFVSPQRKVIIRALAEPKLAHEIAVGKIYDVRYDASTFVQDTVIRPLFWPKWAAGVSLVLGLSVAWIQRVKIRAFVSQLKLLVQN